MGSQYDSVDPAGLSARRRRTALRPCSGEGQGVLPPAAESPQRTADGDVPGGFATASQCGCRARGTAWPADCEEDTRLDGVAEDAVDAIRRSGGACGGGAGAGRDLRPRAAEQPKRPAAATTASLAPARPRNERRLMARRAGDSAVTPRPLARRLSRTPPPGNATSANGHRYTVGDSWHGSWQADVTRAATGALPLHPFGNGPVARRAWRRNGGLRGVDGAFSVRNSRPSSGASHKRAPLAKSKGRPGTGLTASPKTYLEASPPGEDGNLSPPDHRQQA